MTAVKWAKTLADIRKGKKCMCPECGKDTLQTEYRKITSTDGMVILSCKNCGKMVHFSHQKSL